MVGGVDEVDVLLTSEVVFGDAVGFAETSPVLVIAA